MTISFLPRSSAAVANTILQLAIQDGVASDKMPNALRLQRLVYIAHGYSLAILSSRLVSDRLLALDVGPIFPALRDATAHFDASPIAVPIACRDRGPFAHDQGVLIDRVWLKYGQIESTALHALAYDPESPWAMTTPDYDIAPDKIAAYFSRRAA